ncbi:hypothetical protein [Chitinophaga cymbidii]|nr:hypothetical protein [Chitinophaga cymbidii]
MGRVFLYQAALICLLFMVRPLRGLGNSDVRPVAVTDTVPAAPKPAEKGKEKETVKKQKPDILKEVPKTRRKLKPIPIPTPIPVKPIKVIKPKVIKRVTGLIR